MIDAVQGLGHADGLGLVERFQSGAADMQGADPGDVAHFNRLLADPVSVDTVHGANLSTPPVGDDPVRVAQAGNDPWITTEPATAPAAAVGEASTSFGDRILDGINRIREARDGVEGVTPGDTGARDPAEMLPLLNQMMYANFTIHLVTSEVSGFVNKVDGLIKSG